MKVPQPRYGLLIGKRVIPTSDALMWLRAPAEERSVFLELDCVGNVRVSTIFLGLNHQWDLDNQPPLWFETMIFGGKHDQYQVRSSTYDDALEQHEYALNLVLQSTNFANRALHRLYRVLAYCFRPRKDR